MNMASQWTTVGWMVLCGFCMGTAFDMYRVIVHRFRLPRWLLPALDLLYWTAATLVVFQVLRQQNGGEVRLYVFLGLGIGVTMYFALASAMVLRLTGWLLDGMRRIAYGIGKMFRFLIVSPAMMLVRFLAKVLDIVFIVTAALLLWLCRFLLVPLKPLGRYMWARMLPIRKKARQWLSRWAAFCRKVREIFRKTS